MDHSDKRVLVTGGNGFIGAPVVKWLILQGYTPHLMLRTNADQSRLVNVSGQYDVLEGDLQDAQLVSKIVRDLQPTHCIHMAWYAVAGKYHHAPENLDMLIASINLAQQLSLNGCKRFVGIGTCFEYDTTYGYLTEQTPIRPLNLYASCKTAFSEVLRHESILNPVWIRLFYQYGTYESEKRLVPSIITHLLRGESVDTSEGKQIRDYLHVDDVAAAIGFIMESSLSGAINVGSGIPISVSNIIAIIEGLTGRTDLVRRGALPQNPSDPAFICANIDRLKTQTLWQPRCDLQTGLKDTIQWWLTELERG